MTPFFRLTSLCLVAALGTGCASNTKFDAKQVNGRPTPAPLLYANLMETEDGWRFVDIARNACSEARLCVELGRYELSVVDIPQKMCFRGFMGLTSGDCDMQMHSSEVRGGSYVLGPLVIWWVTPILLLPGIFAPENLDRWVLPVFSDQKFDWDKYMSAVNEAKSAENYDHRFAAIHQKYQNLHANLTRSLPENAERSADEYGKASQELLSRRSSELKQEVAQKVAIRIQDHSGLLSSQAVESEVRGALTANVHLPSPNLKRTELQAYTGNEDVRGGLFPASSLDQLEQRLNQQQSVVTTRQQNNDRIEATNQQLESADRIENERRWKAYQSALQNGKALASLQVGTYGGVMSGVNHRLILPDTLSIQHGAVSGDPLIVAIDSVNFNDVIPARYSNSNGDLQLELKDEHIRFTNRTNRYITIDALSLYYNDEILTVGGEGFQGYRELPPNSEASVSLSAFDLNRLSDDFFDMTKAKAQAQTVKFGFAAKYRNTDMVVAKTLFRQDTLSLYSLIKDR